VLSFELQCVNLFRLDEDMVIFGLLVALNDFFFGDLLEALLGLNAL
jgi:hypothetical protein